jgi:hypothetical protein
MAQKTIRIARSAKSGKFTIGAKASARISEVEGLTLSRDMRSTFREFEKKGASADARRKELIDKYGKKGR